MSMFLGKWFWDIAVMVLGNVNIQMTGITVRRSSSVAVCKLEVQVATWVLLGMIEGGCLFTFAVLLLSRNYCSRYLGVGQYCIVAIYSVANMAMD